MQRVLCVVNICAYTYDYLREWIKGVVWTKEKKRKINWEKKKAER